LLHEIKSPAKAGLFFVRDIPCSVAHLAEAMTTAEVIEHG
jgi:hypothetical protein